jgi:hypothetical protein
MRAHLSLVRGEARGSSFVQPPYQLDERTQRPGELADLVPIELTPDLRAHAEALASRARLPLPLAITLAVEAERALDEAATAVGVAVADLAADLDLAAMAKSPPDLDPRATRPLRAYAAALRSGGYKLRRAQRLELVVPDRLRARWTLAATEAGLSLEEWIALQLEGATSSREQWEAQAAFEARALAEWVSLQALRRSRSSSSSAQPPASA